MYRHHKRSRGEDLSDYKDDTEGDSRGHTTDVNMEEEQSETSVKELLNRLHLQGRYENKLTTAEFLQIKQTVKHDKELSESDLCSVYLHKLLMLDYKARYIQAKQGSNNTQDACEGEIDYFECDSEDVSDQTNIHPLDIQMAVFHCSDSFLKQTMITKLSQCQYALPLLVPDPFSGDIECPLWTFRQIQKTWKKTEYHGDEKVVTMKSMSICKAETPMVLCFRLGSLSKSKSQIINTLINDNHKTFFHKDCTGSTKHRLLFDGVADIAWYCPDGISDDSFTDCVAFCNLHGDALIHRKQLNILMDKSSVNVVFVKTLDRKHESAAVIKRLLESPKPVIILVENSGNMKNLPNTGNHRIGLKDRSQADVSQELKEIIKGFISGSHQSFQLESITHSGLRVDEKNDCCQKGLSCSKEIMKAIESVKVSDVKKKFLPCQGQLWHDWSKTNKELYHLKGNVDIAKHEKLEECKKLRGNQCKSSGGKLMKTFVGHLSSLRSTEREYFLKWTKILLDDYGTYHLSSILQNYNQKWSEVMEIKKQCEEKKKSEHSKEKKTPDRSNELKIKQKELAKISYDLQSATCGLEHMFREMAQIYEAHKDLKKHEGHEKTDWSKYPELAAELMISGHPMELMDGDAGHVPLTWIKSLIKQVALKLGNSRVFVLSVLGIQSSGKSTMLNAMFGLQFAVSAGRCTRGAFMQLVQVSEDMKSEWNFQWDYILVVDTEGLRALELDGNKTFHHDNELATFVVGLGDMTVVNIFGENPSEMQDILQIVVQAFMRMNKVNLSPSCVFVHQNVTDVSASEKNMDGRRKLLEKLDMMVQLAAKEEVCTAESFSDIIKFDVQNDVKYFAQLWEGSPPMAPPNPGYSESIQELKNFILEKAKSSPGVSFSDFSSKVKDLWNALLNENFVFSFKNTKEIAVYRKLEVQYGNWTWALRSAMLSIEDELHKNINNGDLSPIDASFLSGKVEEEYKKMKDSMSKYFETDEDKEMLIQWRGQHENKIKEFLDELIRGLQKKMSNVIEQKKATKGVEEKKNTFENTLLEKSKDLARKLKNNLPNDEELRKLFDDEWKKWVSELTRGTKPAEQINWENDTTEVIKENGFERDLILLRKNPQNYTQLAKCGDYSDYVGQKPRAIFKKLFTSDRLCHEDQEQIKNFITEVKTQASEEIGKNDMAQKGYNSSYLMKLCSVVKKHLKTFEARFKYPLKNEFKVDLILYVFHSTKNWIVMSHDEFIRVHDVRTYLESQKDDYFRVFSSFCKGASSAVGLAELISRKLKTSITETVRNKTAHAIAGELKNSIPAFNQNPVNLEKHILTSLAKKEEFDRFIQYIKNPKAYTEQFITEEVEQLLYSNTRQDDEAKKLKIKCHSYFKTKISEIKENVLRASHEASTNTKAQGKGISHWLQEFTNTIKGDVTFPTINPQNFCDINKFDFLNEEIRKSVESICSELSNLSVDILKQAREEPHEILIKQLCDIRCWEKCPFCSAVCTSSKGHTADHSTPYHRSSSLRGWHFRGTVEMFLSFCTSEVAGNRKFHPDSSDRTVPYNSYKNAGSPYNTWSITADKYEMTYWQWVVCRFQTEIENYYNLKYKGDGNIPHHWRGIQRDTAIANLDKMK